MPAGEFETGTVTIALMQVDAFNIDFSPNTTPLEFHVDDFDAAKAELESRGVEFVTDVIDSGVCKQAIFQDPDGNALAIHHRYAPGAPPRRRRTPRWRRPRRRLRPGSRSDAARNPRIRRQASSDSCANSSCFLSKKECGAPG